jgi:hypothetical protein
LVAHARPVFERLVRDGPIGAWGLTGIGHPDTIIRLVGLCFTPRTGTCFRRRYSDARARKIY